MSHTVRAPTGIAVAFVALVVGAAACGSPDGQDVGSRRAGNLAPCPTGALEAATAPVHLEMWHSFPEESQSALQVLADQFNASQPDVVVDFEQFSSYDTTLRRFLDGVPTGDSPGLVVLEDTATQRVIDSGAALPVESCIRATGYDIEGVLPRVRDYYTVDDVLWPMPFNTSSPLMYYNRSLFEAAGLDPDRPPATFDDLRVAVEKLSAVVEVPIALKLGSGYLEQWLVMDNEPFVNEDNGRAGLATETEFDGPAGLEIFEFFDELEANGGLVAYPTDSIENLLAMGQGRSAITFDTSAVIGPAVAAVGAGQFPELTLDDLVAAPLPKPTRDAKYGPSISGGALYLVKGTDAHPVAPEVQEAAWRFAMFLNEPASQAYFALRSGYVPISAAAANEPIVQAAWAEHPFFRVAYDEIAKPVDPDATPGPVMGNFIGVRQAVIAAMQSMLTDGIAPADALAAAATESDAMLEEYRQQVEP